MISLSVTIPIGKLIVNLKVNQQFRAMQCNTYLTFDGNCEEAMNFYKDILGGEFRVINRFNEMPSDVFDVPEKARDLIMHCTLAFDGCILMGSDTLETEKFTRGTGSTISLNAAEDEAIAIFNGLGEGGEVVMPFEDAFWGGKFGMITDKFGVQWMVTSEHKPAKI